MQKNDEFYDSDLTDEQKALEKLISKRIKSIEKDFIRDYELDERRQVFLDPGNTSGLKTLLSNLYMDNLKKDKFSHHLEKICKKYDVQAADLDDVSQIYSKNAGK